MAGLFNTLSVSKRGINAMQSGLNVTSHNISNSSRSDYTRQRARVEASSPITLAGVSGQVGTGANVEMIERVRDTFLDYQIRNENSKLADLNVKQNVLSEIEKLVNESGDSGLGKLFDKFFDSWQELSKNPGDMNARTIVLQESANLADEFNRIHGKLQEAKVDVTNTIRSSAIEVNSILDEISALNQKIQEVSIMGNQPNDFMDKRDALLDQLSSKLNIRIDSKDNNGIEVASNDIKPSTLVGMKDLDKNPRLTFIDSIEENKTGTFPKDIKITYYKNNDSSNLKNKVEINIKNMSEENYKLLKDNRIVLTDKEGKLIDKNGIPSKNTTSVESSKISLGIFSSGQLGGLQKAQLEIDSFTNQINQLAKALVFSVNAVHSGQKSAIKGGHGGKPLINSHDTLPFFVNSSIAKYEANGILKDSKKVAEAEKEITAGNISINRELIDNPQKLKVRENDHMFQDGTKNTIDGVGNGKRALAIASLRETTFNILEIGKNIKSREDFFTKDKGGNDFENNGLDISSSNNGEKIEGNYKNIVTTLGINTREAARDADNFDDVVYNLEVSRMSVSGVSLDEEMSNLITFQHAYNANAKVISTVDKLLDVIINGLIS